MDGGERGNEYPARVSKGRVSSGCGRAYEKSEDQWLQPLGSELRCLKPEKSCRAHIVLLISFATPNQRSNQ